MIERWLILYDISDSRRLVKVAHTLEDHAIRVQKSLFEFEGYLRELLEIKAALEDIVDLESDYILFIPQCDDDSEMALKIGMPWR